MFSVASRRWKVSPKKTGWDNLDSDSDYVESDTEEEEVEKKEEDITKVADVDLEELHHDDSGPPPKKVSNSEPCLLSFLLHFLLRYSEDGSVSFLPQKLRHG